MNIETLLEVLVILLSLAMGTATGVLVFILRALIRTESRLTRIETQICHLKKLTTNH